MSIEKGLKNNSVYIFNKTDKMIKNDESMKVKVLNKNLDDNMEDQLISLKNFKGQTSFNAKVEVVEGPKAQILKQMKPGNKRWLYEWL